MLSSELLDDEDVPVERGTLYPLAAAVSPRPERPDGLTDADPPADAPLLLMSIADMSPIDELSCALAVRAQRHAVMANEVFIPAE